MSDDRVVTELVTYRGARGGGVEWALGTTVRDGSQTPAAAAELVRTLPGVRVETSDDALVAELVSLGGRVQRRAHDYEYDLRGTPASFVDPALSPKARLEPVGVGDAEALASAHEEAYPPGHPDHDPALDHVEDLRQMLAGEVIGPLCHEASWLVTVDGEAQGAVLVVDRPPFGDMTARLWVVDVFVHPAVHGQGLGRALLQRSLLGARETAHTFLGLVVSDGNPARRLYESVGFTLVGSGTNIDLPPRTTA